jgi:hypothetical protein
MAKEKLMELTYEEERSFFLMEPCSYCKHLLTTGTQENRRDPLQSFQGWTCRAFPNGIPSDILTREVRHTEPDWGQAIGNTFVYESKVFEFTHGPAKMSWDGEWVVAT